MEFSAQQIADILGGLVEGNPEASVNSLSKIEEGQPGTLTFLSNPKYQEYIYETRATIAIVDHSFKLERKAPKGLTLVRVEDARQCFAKLLELYDQTRNYHTGISETASIDPSAKIGNHVYIGDYTVIGKDVIIEDNTRIFPHCYIGDNVGIGHHTTVFSGVKVYVDGMIGSYCTIHAGAVIGSDGFGFAPNSENNYAKVPQIGNVVLEDHVEIGANTTVDRATLGSTIIRRGVKLDNLIQIAHNVEIGENTVIAAQTGIAGSTKIGKNCMIGGQVGIVGHIQIADGVKIAAQSGIQNTITEENSIYQGSPAFPIMDYKKSYVGFRKLPGLMQEMAQLKKEIDALKSTTLDK